LLDGEAVSSAHDVPSFLQHPQDAIQLMTTLRNIAEENYSNDPVTKPLAYYDIYERTLVEENLAPKCILEIGVYQGESTKVLSRRFPESLIVAVDLNLRGIDFSGYSNIHYLQCDQTDRRKLEAICKQYFPNGLDLVIEDASHIGHFSCLTFKYLFPFVKSGGVYIVEDWGTGYWPNWTDGGTFAECAVSSSPRRISKVIRSHDYGMVGFVKSLVDYAAEEDISDERARSNGWISRLFVHGSRISILRNAVNRFPDLKARLAKIVSAQTGAPEAASADRIANRPRLKSVKFFRGVCVACKA
jgi:23S rRNA U2552 (ribose-2'-O)-methylase RlmE/FtsJ